MDIVLIVLRLIHIVAGVIWVGGGILMAVVIGPALAKMGDDGSKFMRALTADRRFTILFPAAAVTTTVAGLLLFATGPQNRLSNAGFIVLIIGSLAGIGAAGHGGAVLGRLGAAFMALADKVAQNPTPETRAELQAFSAKYTRHLNISVGMMLVAVIGMSLARYL
jgi:uncharacterized membrane protein